VHDFEAAERERVWREATTMVLYVALVLIATLAVLPAGHSETDGSTHGPVGVELIGIMWGTTIGLALAHLFAFQVAMQGLGAGLLRGQAFEEAVAQLAGAALVAALASLPVLFLPPETEQQAVPFVLAMIIGGVSYLVERAHGRTRTRSVIFGLVTLLVASVVATLKILLSSH
jgi:hypothetical protein